MKNLISKMLLILMSLFMTTLPVRAADPFQQQRLAKADIKNIKFISSDVDHIHMFMTSHNKETYRFSDLKQDEAKKILDHIKSESTLILNSAPNGRREYHEVDSWE